MSTFCIYTFLNSGCVIFPITQTCFYSFDWSLNKELIQDTKVWFELWSKSGARPNFVIENRIEDISNDYNYQLELRLIKEVTNKGSINFFKTEVSIIEIVIIMVNAIIVKIKCFEKKK